jgi:predicted nucleic acid-binding protein
LLDTTFLIDAERTGAGLDELIEDDDDVAIAAITAAERRAGVELSRGKTQSSRHEFLDDVLASIPLLEYDLDVAEAHTELLIAVRKQDRPPGGS